MKFRNLLTWTLSMTAMACTGERDPHQRHELAKDTSLVSSQNSPETNGSVEFEELRSIAAIANLDDRFAKGQMWMLKYGFQLSASLTPEYLKLIQLCFDRWESRGSFVPFVKFIDGIWDEEFHLKINPEAIKGLSLKKLIASVAEKKELSLALRVKMILSYRNLAGRQLETESIDFISSQLQVISAHPDFKFLQKSQTWAKVSRDLAIVLVEKGADGGTSLKSSPEVALKQSVSNGSALSPSERLKYLGYAIKNKKSLDLALTSLTLSESQDYDAQFERTVSSLSQFTQKIGLRKVQLKEHTQILISLLNGDLKVADIEKFVGEGLISKNSFLADMEDWLKFELAKIVFQFKENWKSFSERRKSIPEKDFFPEFNRITAGTQIYSRDRSAKLDKLGKIARVLGNELLAKRYEDSDLFLKRLLTANSSLVLLHLLNSQGQNLEDRIQLNSMVMKKDSSATVKLERMLPNILFLSENFYLGNLPDQFNFSVNDRMMQKNEVLDGIEEGFRLGLYKELGLEPSEVVRSMVSYMITSRTVKIETLNRKQFQETKFFELHEIVLRRLGSSGWSDFMNICSAWKGQRPAKREFSLDDVRTSLSVGRLADALVDGSTSREFGTSKAIGLFPYNGELTKTLEFLRSDTTHALLFFDTLIGFLHDAGESSQSVKPGIDEFRQRVSRFLGDVLFVAKNFDPCFLLSKSKERELIAKVLEYEHHYWTQVAQTLEGKLTLSPQEMIKLDYASDPRLAYRSSITGGVLSLYKFDFYFRLKQYLQYGMTYRGARLPPIDPSLEMRLDPELASLSIYKEASIIPVDLKAGSAESRIRKVFYAHKFGDNETVNWFETSYLAPSKFVEQLETYDILFRMGASLKEVYQLQAGIDLPLLSKIHFDVLHHFHLSNSLAPWYDLLNITKFAPISDLKNYGLIMVDDFATRPIFDSLLLGLSRSLMSVYGNSSYVNTLEDSFSAGVAIPPELISIGLLGTGLLRYFDESYISPLRGKKLPLSNYFSVFAAERVIGSEVLAYVEEVEKTSAGKPTMVRLEPGRIVQVDLVSSRVKTHFKNKLAEMEQKLSAIRKAQERAQEKNKK